jgi:hypothetical protein
MNHLKGLETIFSDFHKLCSEIYQKSQNIHLVKSDVESFFIKNLIISKENQSQVSKQFFELLSKLSLLKIIRLYQAGLNQNFKTLEVLELSNSLLKQTLSLSDLQSWYSENISSTPSEVICFYLPDDYQANCLNIFESTFRLASSSWVLKGISLLRENFSSVIVRRQKNWSFESVNKTINNYSNLRTALQAAAEIGFIPAAFWYFNDCSQVASEVISNDLINFLTSLQLQFKEKKNFKGKNFRDLKKVIREEAKQKGIDLGFYSKAKQSQIYTSCLTNALYGRISANMPQNNPPLNERKSGLTANQQPVGKTPSLEKKGLYQEIPKNPSSPKQEIPKAPSYGSQAIPVHNSGIQGTPVVESFQNFSPFKQDAQIIASDVKEPSSGNPSFVAKVQSPVKNFEVASDPFSLPINPYDSIEKQPPPLPNISSQVSNKPHTKYENEFSIKIKRGVNSSNVYNLKEVENQHNLGIIVEEPYQQVSNSWKCGYCEMENGYHLPLCEHHIICSCGYINYITNFKCYNCNDDLTKLE